MSADERRDRRPSIRDVAAQANVSTKTVSNVLHGQIRVAEDTKARVLNAIAELDYQPDLHARRLRNGRSGLIALALPNLDLPFFAELTSQVVLAARAHDYTVLVDETTGSPDREADLLSGIAPRFADGVIISPQGLSPDQLSQLVQQTTKRAPIVLLGEHAANSGIDHVTIDNVRAGADATRHLLGLGRTRIAAIGLPPGYDDAQEHALERLKGYREALERAGLPYDPQLVMEGSARRPADGAQAMRYLLDLSDPPDAVFCFTDLLALGAIRALYEAGARIPGDVAVVGFDNIAQTSYSVPTITTIEPDKAALAASAVELLLAKLPAAVTKPRTVIVGHELIVRESTAGREW